MRKIILVIDMQNDFIYGPLGTPEAVEITEPLCEYVKGAGCEVIFTRDTHTADYLTTAEGRRLPVVHCIEKTQGWQIAAPLAKLAERVFDKPTFGSTALAEYLVRENAVLPIDEIELCGVCTDICVISNAMLIKAHLPECRITVNSRLCAGTSPEAHERALLCMQGCHIEII